MGHKVGWKMTGNFDRLTVEFRDKGFKLTVPPESGPKTTLNPDWFKFDQWSDQKIIVSVGQLIAGLPIPLIDMQIPLFYRILSHLSFKCAIYQLSGDAIRIMVEFARRAASLRSLHPKEYWNPAYADVEINPAEYTLEKFFSNYDVAVMKPAYSRWVVRLVRKDGLAENERIM